MKNGLPDEVSTIELKYRATNPIDEIMIPPKNTITMMLDTQPCTGIELKIFL